MCEKVTNKSAFEQMSRKEDVVAAVLPLREEADGQRRGWGQGRANVLELPSAVVTACAGTGTPQESGRSRGQPRRRRRKGGDAQNFLTGPQKQPPPTLTHVHHPSIYP